MSNSQRCKNYFLWIYYCCVGINWLLCLLILIIKESIKLPRLLQNWVLLTLTHISCFLAVKFQNFSFDIFKHKVCRNLHGDWEKNKTKLFFDNTEIERASESTLRGTNRGRRDVWSSFMSLIIQHSAHRHLLKDCIKHAQGPYLDCWLHLKCSDE